MVDEEFFEKNNILLCSTTLRLNEGGGISLEEIKRNGTHLLLTYNMTTNEDFLSVNKTICMKKYTNIIAFDKGIEVSHFSAKCQENANAVLTEYDMTVKYGEDEGYGKYNEITWQEPKVSVVDSVEKFADYLEELKSEHNVIDKGIVGRKNSFEENDYTMLSMQKDKYNEAFFLEKGIVAVLVYGEYNKMLFEGDSIVSELEDTNIRLNMEYHKDDVVGSLPRVRVLLIEVDKDVMEDKSVSVDIAFDEEIIR